MLGPLFWELRYNSNFESSPGHKLMKFGGFYEHQLPRPWASDSEHTLLKNALEQAVLSDQCGYDYVWATEHHFLEEYAHSSAPEVFLAAVSQRTKNIRIGHGIVQTPPHINHPARIAERIATLDLLSDGRVEFGTGAGATETELGGFLVPQAEKKNMQLEGMRVAVRMLVESPFTGYDGQFVKVPARNVVPKPLQKPHPPLWMACSRRESIIQAAKLGMGALTFSFVSPEEARQWVKDYYHVIENECEPLGYAVNPNFAVAAPFLCDRDQKRVEQIGAESYGFFLYGLGHYSFFGEHRPAMTDIWEEFKNHPKEFAPPEGRTQDCVGTPAMLRERLRDFEQAGIDQVLCISQAGKIPHDLLCSSIELFSKEVLPEFKERDLANATKQSERRARINEKAMARKPKVEPPNSEIVIRAAGHH
jgi:alkanesulfonate monooxygenase SsuD/methylene tetrahydromethanopterin reductase-like flavin-dependent oxidoreductase (luciferase family)